MAEEEEGGNKRKTIMDQQTAQLFEMLPEEMKADITQQVNHLVLSTVKGALQQVQPASTEQPKETKAPPEVTFSPPPKVKTRRKKAQTVTNGEATKVKADELRERLPTLLVAGEEYARREIVEVCQQNHIVVSNSTMTQVLGRLMKEGVLTSNGEKTQKMKYRLA